MTSGARRAPRSLPSSAAGAVGVEPTRREFWRLAGHRDLTPSAPSTWIAHASSRRQRDRLTRCVRGLGLLAASRTQDKRIRNSLLGFRRDEEMKSSAHGGGCNHTGQCLKLVPLLLGYMRAVPPERLALPRPKTLAPQASASAIPPRWHSQGDWDRTSENEHPKLVHYHCATPWCRVSVSSGPIAVFSGAQSPDLLTRRSVPTGIRTRVSELRIQRPWPSRRWEHKSSCALRGTIPHLSIESRGSRPLDEGRLVYPVALHTLVDVVARAIVRLLFDGPS